MQAAPEGDRAACRLCGGPLERRFSLVVLGKHTVAYFQCGECRSLQTEPPYWLDEAYGTNNLSRLDTGAAQRNLHNLAASYAMARLFRPSCVVDVGGGDGLLCRLLRDYGVNCFVRDKYASPTYAQGYTQDGGTPQMVLAFEVLEHFADPAREVDELFALGADVYLLSTSLYAGEGADWWYLVPKSGQHVFFFSRQALAWIAARHGYALVTSGGFILFARNVSRAKLRLAWILLHYHAVRLLRAWVVTRPAPGVWRDHDEQRKRFPAH